MAKAYCTLTPENESRTLSSAAGYTKSQIQGELEITNYNREITAENISGSVVATTYNGEIRAFDKVTEGTPMSFSTYNGDIDFTFPATLSGTYKVVLILSKSPSLTFIIKPLSESASKFSV